MNIVTTAWAAAQATAPLPAPAANPGDHAASILKPAGLLLPGFVDGDPDNASHTPGTSTFLGLSVGKCGARVIDGKRCASRAGDPADQSRAVMLAPDQQRNKRRRKMTENELSQLQLGDVIRHKHSSEGMVVVENLGDGRVIAVRTTVVTNAHEWDVIQKAAWPQGRA